MIKGTYRVYKEGILVAEVPNVITTRGRAIILRYLAGNIGVWAGAIAVGTGTVAPTVANTKLNFEFARGPVVLRAAETTLNRVVFKASLPLEAAGVIHELGIYPYIRQTDTEYAGQVYISFEPSLEGLSGGTANATSFRLGTDSYSVTAPANTTTIARASQAAGNFSGYGSTDTFTLAYFTADANAASILVRLKVDDANYFSYTLTPPTTVGYNVVDWAKSAFVATGTPSWDNITSAEFAVTAKAGGATTVNLDGLRVNDVDVYPDYGLVSRAVLATPEVKLPGEQMDIEYALEFTF